MLWLPLWGLIFEGVARGVLKKDACYSILLITVSLSIVLIQASLCSLNRAQDTIKRFSIFLNLRENKSYFD